MSTRSTSNDLVSPLSNPESVIRYRRRNLGDPTLLVDFEEIDMNHNNIQEPPPVGPIQQNYGPPGPNLQNSAPDLRTMEELCQPTMNGRGRPIAPVNIQATDFRLKNHMIQQNMKQNGVSDDALRLYLFPYSLTHHATAWFDRLPKNSIHTFLEMASKFLSKYFPPSMVTKLRNDISNFRQLPDESLFEAWERYKLSINRCSNHNMLLINQIDTFYNGLTLRHRDTINAAARDPSNAPDALPFNPSIPMSIIFLADRFFTENKEQAYLRRPFLRTARTLVDVYREELVLRDGDEKLIFHADSTLKHPQKHRNESINMINFINITCDDHFEEVLKIKKPNHPLSGSPTPSSDPAVESLSPSLTPFGDIDLLLEETDTFLSLDDSIPSGIDNGIYDSKGDILFLEELLNDEIPRDLPPNELKDNKPSTTKSLIEKPLGIDNEIYDSEGDILFLENLLKDDPIKDLPPHELNNDSEGYILFLENLLKDEPLETKRSEIYTLIGEPPDTFLMGDEEIKFNPFKDINDPVPIPRVFETLLDSLDPILDSYDTAYTNPLFELDAEYTLNYDNPIFYIQNEHSDEPRTETIMDEVHSTTQIPPLFEELASNMSMQDIILYRIRHGMVNSSRLSIYLDLLSLKGVFESLSSDSFELGDQNVVFDPRTIIIKHRIEHYYRGDIPAMDVPDLHLSPKNN
ncbi:reverse transcriptase domain-containing protein [Tanacetum coccineum]